MNPTFKIQTTDTVTAKAKLFIEAGLQGISWMVIDKGRECVALSSYHFTSEISLDKAASLLKEIVLDNPLLQEKFETINIVYTYPTSILVPGEMMEEAAKKEMLELLYGDITDVFIRTDFMYKQNLYNIYTVPRQMDAVVSYILNGEVSTHLYSLLPDIITADNNHLYCIFGNGYFTAMLLKAGKLQAIQTWQFKAPEDVAFYLLQFSEAFEVDIHDTAVHLNGMIDNTSNLYNELNKYFLHLQFEALSQNFTYPQEIADYPSHYFSHLFALASCV